MRLPNKRSSLILSSGPADPQPQTQPVLQPEILGIRPGLLAPTNPPVGRPSAYVWVVRKWLKNTNESVLSGMMAQLDVRRREGSERVPLHGAGRGEVELRLEWTKAKPRRHRADVSSASGTGVGRRTSLGPGARDAGRRTSAALSSATHSQSSLHETSPTRSGRGPRARASTNFRGSLDQSPAHDTRSLSTADHEDDPADAEQQTPRVPSAFPARDADDDGDESDPEDSETPWMCYLVVRRVHPGGAALVAAGADGEQVRTRVASLSPTPHHPKVVAMLKVPFPLPDVEVEQMNVRHRTLTPAGVARPALGERGASNGSNGSQNGRGNVPGAGHAKEPQGLVLTAEEIKDVVSTTGMWLVVREGIGGVGRVTRKGDGWRIRG
jgi:hypothetical protein